jgi:alkyl hydroperoxide reductase subunit F
MLKDLIIIGAGPAGITAAVYAARKKLDFCVVSEDIGGQTTWSGDIENYIGFQFISGPELTEKFKDHLEKYSFDLKEGVEVLGVKKEGNIFQVSTSSNEILEAKTLIISTGKSPRRLGVPGEKEFKSRGVSYCATCDGPLFAGKEIAVIGGGNSGLDATLQLMNIAKKVYLIEKGEKLSGDAVMRQKARKSNKVEILEKTSVLKISGDKFVKSISVEKDGKSRELPVEGMFIEVGLTPNSALIDIVEKNTHGEIIVNCSCETSVHGLFAAGDVTSVPAKQIIVAAGEGAKALLSAFRYLSTH